MGVKMNRIKILMILLLSLCVTALAGCEDEEGTTDSRDDSVKTIVDKHGQLRIDGVKIVDEKREIVALRGMSLFWSQWGGEYYNAETVKWLVDDWKCTMVRAAMGVESGGYLDNSQAELQKVTAVIDAAIENGIYVIVDWHDHHAEDHLADAITFFDYISKTYGDTPNVIYEIYNEPLDVSWNDVIKPYAEEVVSAIRRNDRDNIIIVGTPNWSQDVDSVLHNGIAGWNIAYSFHFYSSTHGQDIMGKAATAINAGLPVIVTEWGLSEASGDGEINLQKKNDWLAFMESYNLSWCNWSIISKEESSAALLSTTTKVSGWSEGDLTLSGTIIRAYLNENNAAMFEE